MVTGIDENGDEITKVWLYVKWRTGGERWKNKQWLQHYFQIGDSEAVNTRLVMTCNVEYRRDNLISETVFVENFYGQESFKIKDNENNKSWNTRGIFAEEDMEWFKADEEGLIPDNYLNEWEDRISYSSCVAIAPMYSIVNGEAEDRNLNKKYFMAQKSVPATLHTGFRLFNDGEEIEYDLGADANEV